MDRIKLLDSGHILLDVLLYMGGTYEFYPFCRRPRERYYCIRLRHLHPISRLDQNLQKPLKHFFAHALDF